MATRLYLPSSGAAAVTPTRGANYDFEKSGFASYAAVKTKGTTAFTTVTDNTAVGYLGSMMLCQWVSPKLQAQTIATSTMVTMAIRGRYATGSPTSYITAEVGICSEDGATKRYNAWVQGWNADALSGTLASLHERMDTIAPWTVQENDRIYIQIGMRHNPITAWTLEIDIGDNSANDVPYSIGDTNQYAPWIEFSQTLYFDGDPMPTRMYLPSSGTAPIPSLAFDSTYWSYTTNAVNLPLVTTKSSTSMVSKGVAVTGTNPGWHLWYQYQSPPLSEAVTFTAGVDTFGFGIMASESSGSSNSYSSICIRIWDTSAGTWLDTTPNYLCWDGEGAEFTTTLHNQYKAAMAVLNTYTADVGDRIIINIGFQKQSTASYTTTMRIGDNGAADVADNTGTTNTVNPWVQSSKPLKFSAETAASTFYLPSNYAAPAVSPSVHSGWYQNRSDFFRGVPVIAKSSSANADANTNSYAGTSYQSECAQQWIYGPIKGKTVIAQTVCVGIMGHHDLVWGYHWLKAAMWIMKPDLSLRGTIVANTVLYDDSSFPQYTYSSRFVSGTSTEVIALQGDYLVMELGFENQSGSAMLSYLQLGDNNASDIITTDSTTVKNPIFGFATTGFEIYTAPAAGGSANLLMLMGYGT